MKKLTFMVVISIVAVVSIGLLGSNAIAAGKNFPDEIDLPDGFFPEGIAIGRGTDFYVGSLANGSIYKGDLRTGEGVVLTDEAGQFATIGIEVDNKERIWVAGGPYGTGRVYDGSTGELLAVYEFTGPFESFINDVVVTNEAAYFTDSGTAEDNPNPGGFWFAGEPRLFVVSLGSDQTLPDPADPAAVSTLMTNLPDIGFPNLNGIETTPGGANLVVSHTSAQALFTVDPASGNGSPINTDVPPLLGADGIIRRGNTIYVVENAAAQISAVKIAPDGSAGTRTAVYSVEGSETPTTAGLFGNALYAVDAKFGTMDDPYKVFRVELR